jgi:hypothetical protein
MKIDLALLVFMLTVAVNIVGLFVDYGLLSLGWTPITLQARRWPPMAWTILGVQVVGLVSLAVHLLYPGE